MNRACLPLLCSLAALLAALPAAAQLQINSSPNPVGSGARALGMGGAFVAVADDATAASWNPGGLTQLERPEVSLVVSHKWFEEDFSSESHPELGGNFNVDFSDINYFSFAYPIQHTIAGRNLVFSLNYQTKFDFDRKIKVEYRKYSASPFGIFDTEQHVNYEQKGQLAALSPAFGFELLNNLSVGVVWNIWDSNIVPGNGWETNQTNHARGLINNSLFAGSYSYSTLKSEYEDFRANNFTLGTLYKPNQRWSIGLTYNTKFKASVNLRETGRNFRQGGFSGYGLHERPLDYIFPSALALGVAYRFPNDKLTLSMDVTRRDWGQFEIRDPRNTNWRQRHKNGVTGLQYSLSPDVDPVYTVRVGMEYVFVNPKKPKQDYLPSIRAGLFYDPEPSGGIRSTFWGPTKGDGKPEPFYGFTLGGGLLIKNRVNLDLAYTFRTGNGVRSDTFGGVPGTDADVTQHQIYLSTVIYF